MKHIERYYGTEKGYRAQRSAQKVLDEIAKMRESDDSFFPTGFRSLDNTLDGGLRGGELCVIGAISSLGKTTLVQQICDQIAANDYDILFFSLEMASVELVSKSISRLTFELDSSIGKVLAKTSREITSGEEFQKFSLEERGHISKASTRYDAYADGVFIFEGVGGVGILDIEKVLDNHLDLTGGRAVVIVDYLQILATTPESESVSNKLSIDKNVEELKRIAREYDVPVIAISSFNRENYTKPVSMLSFKESGAIEYSSDVLIGLQLKGIGGKDFDVDEAKKKNPRKIELKIIKQRNGATGETISLDYYPKYNVFVESDQLKSDKEFEGIPFKEKKHQKRLTTKNDFP